MIKIILPGSQSFDSPMAKLVDVHSRGVDKDWMSKRAAVLTKEIESVRPEPGKSHIHLIAMGAGEFYGANRNGDWFNKQAGEFKFPEPKEASKTFMDGGLEKYHDTFVKFGNVYRNHVNKDPKIRSGEIKASAYNPDMERVELLVAVDNKKWRDELEKLASGDDIPVSMSCRVPYDICSICGNQASTRAGYCGHLKDHMGQITKSGNQVFAINDQPTFFDLSSVFRNADRIAFSLKKVASAGSVIGSAEIAAQLGINAPANVLASSTSSEMRAKVAALQKLSEIEKEIEGTASSGDPKVKGVSIMTIRIGVPKGNVGDRVLEKLKGLKSPFEQMAGDRVMLPIEDFFKFVMGDRFDSVAGSVEQAKSRLPGIFGRIMGGENLEDFLAGSDFGSSDSSARELPCEMKDLVDSHSLDPEPTKKRVMILKIRGDSDPQIKQASTIDDQGQADFLAKTYAKYQVAFNASVNNDFVRELTALGNYL